MDTVFDLDEYMMLFIDELEKGNQPFVLGFGYPAHVCKATFEKNEKDNFVLKFDLPDGEGPVYEYFFTRPAVLSVPKHLNIFLRNTDAIRVSETISATPKIKIEYQSFTTETDSEKWKNSKHCAYYKYKKKDFHYNYFSLQYSITTSKNQKSEWRNAFVINISGKNVLVSFEESIKGEDAYCIFRSQESMDIVLFEKIVEAIRVSIGLFAGYYFADRAYYVSNYSTRKSEDGMALIFRYKNLSKPLKQHYPILDRLRYKDIEIKELQITEEQFNKLVKLLVEREEYLRTMRLLFDASTIEGPSRGVLAVVALETVSNLMKKKDSPAKIIADKSLANKMTHELKKVLKNVIKEEVSEKDYEKLVTKAEGLNNLPNSVKLESAFEKNGITLNEDDLFCINCRNCFLHGGLPKSNKLYFLTEQELVFVVSQRLIMLTSMLLLKKAGYSGLVNDWGFTNVSKRRAISEGRSIINQGNAHRRV